jgi:hypothetical protein
VSVLYVWCVCVCVRVWRMCVESLGGVWCVCVVCVRDVCDGVYGVCVWGGGT